MELPLFLILSTLLICASLASCKLHNGFTDLESLLAFKDQIADPNDILPANWTTNTSFCNWIGVQCSHRRKRVTAISLYGWSLGGTIPPQLGNLSFLSRLDLGYNELTGQIPVALTHLHRLAFLNLQHNNLSGPVPYSIFNMTSLTELDLEFNNLAGYFPSNKSFAMLPRLQYISLASNHIAGDVGDIMLNFARCQDLRFLTFSDNQFSGVIPADIGRLPQLDFLSLGVNQLTGTIPKSLGNLSTLGMIDLSFNNLTGVIPEELGNLPKLRYLHLSVNSLVGSIPVKLLNSSMMYFFYLDVNMLSGPVPDRIGYGLPSLRSLYLARNQLTGGLKFLTSLSNCKDLQHLVLSQNKLEGVLPDSIGNLSTSLQYFYANQIHASGSIPAELGNLTGLIMLTLGGNELTGEIPPTLTRLTSLQGLALYSNNINGSIPIDMGSMSNLNILSFESNQLTGHIPDSLANISRMQILYLDDNNLSSSVPPSLWTLESLLKVNISSNTLSGSLSERVGNLESLYFLDLSFNQMSGNISRSLGKPQSIQALNLSHNLFSGQIPETFGGLINIVYLNLSHNLLSGPIPNSISNLSDLERLDLSFNRLEGKIPNGRVFSNSSIPSLNGNKALCGAPQLSFPPCSPDFLTRSSKKKTQSLKYILPSTIFVIILICISLICAIFYWRTKVKTLVDADASLGGQRVISHYELVRATTNFSETNLLGRGGFSSVYRGCLDDGTLIAVKVLNSEVGGAFKSFDAECQVLRTVRHRNLIKIISVCSNLNFKALVLQFMPNGSLDKWLYSDNNFLNMLQRLNIMVDVSLALEYLHHRHPHVVLHCDLKPTNVLLDEEMVAHVSDFGISKLLHDDSSSVISASAPGTIGYIAPGNQNIQTKLILTNLLAECATTGTVSRMGDVYSFGILLLEVFTGKKPVDAMFTGESNLRQWISEAYPTAILGVVDCNLLNVNIEGTIRDKTIVHSCLTSVIELGLLCSSYSPKERISMTEVAARLQKIKVEYSSNLSN